MQNTLDSLLRNTLTVGSEDLLVPSEGLQSSQISDIIEEPSSEVASVSPSTDVDGSYTDIHNAFITKSPEEEPKRPEASLMSILSGNRKVIKPKEVPIDPQILNTGNKVNLKDFLSMKKKPEDIIVLSSEPDYPETNNDIELLEAKLRENLKTSAKDLLRSKMTLRPSLMVTLKVDKEALAFYKKFEDPLKTRGNSHYIRSKSLKVTLKISSDKLKPFATKPVATKNARSIFDAMMKGAASNTIKLTPLQRMKEIEPPSIPRTALHVYDRLENNLAHHNEYLQTFHQHEKNPVVEHGSFHYNIDNPYVPFEFKRETTQVEPLTAMKPFEERCPITTPMFRHLYPLMFQVSSNTISWPQLFEPDSTESLLLLDKNKSGLISWLTNSFARLKSQTFTGDRKIAKRKKKAAKDFIVYDDLGEETEEDVFLPLLIIHGDTGTCKSSSVHVAMKEFDGYVHEINAGQPRSRRDLLGVLKELCTTQLIHKQNEDGSFQKGVVLLEDCDILFEQDRTFWTVVQEILEISRRPMIITCTDPSVIPRTLYNVAEETDSILNYDEDMIRDSKIYSDYIWGCCYTQGYDLDDGVLNYILDDCQFDIRKMLTSCQLICQGNNKSLNEVTSIKLNIPDNKIPVVGETLESISDLLELLSLADNMESMLASQLNHAEIPNEFIDIYYIDETTKLKQPLMPHEKTVIDDILLFAEREWKPRPDHTLPQNMYLIREITSEFIGSRAKPLPAILRSLQVRDVPRSTRSAINSSNYDLWSSGTVGVPEDSIILLLSNTPFVTELAPYSYNWCAFQYHLDNLEEELALRTRMFLGWREFKDKTYGPFLVSPFTSR